MVNPNQHKARDEQNSVIMGLASVSKSPFKTAFKAKMGIMAAETLGVFLFIGTVVLIGLIFKYLT